MNARLYVGNLPYRSTEGDLLQHFSSYGEVISVNIVKDKMSGRSKGFGFVEMSSGREAERAIQGLNGVAFQGRAVVVNQARPHTGNQARTVQKVHKYNKPY